MTNLNILTLSDEYSFMLNTSTRINKKLISMNDFNEINNNLKNMANQISDFIKENQKDLSVLKIRLNKLDKSVIPENLNICLWNKDMYPKNTINKTYNKNKVCI